MRSNVNAYFNILQVHSFKRNTFLCSQDKKYIRSYIYFLNCFQRNMQVMLNGILKLQHIFPIKHDTQVIQKKSFYIIYNLLYAWAFYGLL